LPCGRGAYFFTIGAPFAHVPGAVSSLSLPGHVQEIAIVIWIS
jgi:hypothetical protein